MRTQWSKRKEEAVVTENLKFSHKTNTNWEIWGSKTTVLRLERYDAVGNTPW